MPLSDREQSAMVALSFNLGVPVDWLYNLIQFESGFNPAAKNKLSSARGLIQFVDSTARRLGYVDSLDLVIKNPTIESQLLGPVYNYLNQFKPFYTKQSLYLSVFYPAARKWPINARFPDSVIKSNPGIVTVSDYVRKIDNVSNIKKLPYVFAIVAAAWVLFTRNKHKEY